MTSRTYQPHQSRQNVRLGWEAGRRQETSTYPDHLKLKETWSPRRRVLSNPSFPITDSLRKLFQQRQRRKTTPNIIQVPTGNYEMKSFGPMEIKNDSEVERNRELPKEASPISLKNITCGLRPPEVTSSKSVPLILNRPKSAARNLESRSLLAPSAPPSVVIEAPQDSNTEMIQQHNVQQGEPNFLSRATNNPAFWEEWSNIAHRRTSILSLRSRTHEMRRKLREKQNLKSATEDRLMQRVLQQELAYKSTPKTKAMYSPPESILDLVKDCQDARDDFGPFEDQCTSLEDELYSEEFILHRLEEQLYLRWNVVPNLRDDYTEDWRNPNPQARDHGDQESRWIQNQVSQIPSIDYQEERHDYEKVKYHPMVDQYLSKKGDLETLNEQLYEFEERLYGLELDRTSRDRYGMSLHPEDEEFLRNSHTSRDIIMGRIEQTKGELEELRGACFSMRLIDGYGEPTSTEGDCWKFAETDEETNAESPVSEYSKFSILITQPEKVYPEGDADSTSQCLEAAKSSQIAAPMSSHQVEFWMLMSVRCSAIDVNHLARWSKREGITVSDIWQKAVLEFWFKDGYSESIPINRPRTTSLTTQAPQQPKNPDLYSSFDTELPITKESPRSPRYLRPPEADSVVITEIEDIM